jgi:hypothetical protein
MHSLEVIIKNFTRQFEVISEKIENLSIYTVPEYVVGSGQLLLYYNGILCIPGRENQYAEISNENEISIKIQIQFDFEPEDGIIVINFNLL